jgi:2',3'-cyclic-nucleotide 2'-phosphodiesterase (5'-nucleotidase family)
VARRATAIRAIRDETSRPVLVLDAGGALFGEMLAFQTQGRIVAESMSAMGYDAMTVGLMDLIRGSDVLLSRAAESSFPFLSCNIIYEEDGRLLLPPYAVIERGGLHFGIIGVSEEDVLSAPTEAVAGLDVVDPVEAVRGYVAELRPQVDVLIVLSHLGLPEDRALAEAVPGIDVIIGGRSRRFLGEPQWANGVPIVQMGYDGEWLGRLDVALNPDGHVRAAQLRPISLGPEVADDPDVADVLRRYIAAPPGTDSP